MVNPLRSSAPPPLIIPQPSPESFAVVQKVKDTEVSRRYGALAKQTLRHSYPQAPSRPVASSVILTRKPDDSNSLKKSAVVVSGESAINKLIKVPIAPESILTEMAVVRSLEDVCYQNDFAGVIEYLNSHINVDPRDFFVANQENNINALHVASLRGFEDIANVLLDYLKQRDPKFAKEVLLSKYDGKSSSLALTLLGEINAETALVLFEWASKLNVDPKELSEGVEFTKLFDLLNSVQEDDGNVSGEALSMLLRTMACFSLEKEAAKAPMVATDHLFIHLYRQNFSSEEHQRLMLLQAFFGSEGEDSYGADVFSLEQRVRSWSV